MQAHVEYDWISRSVNVRAWSEAAQGVRWLWRPDNGRVEWPEGEHIEPSLTIREDVFEAIMREAEKVVPAGSATTEALRDSRQVRDRLLTLVETLAVKP